MKELVPAVGLVLIILACGSDPRSPGTPAVDGSPVRGGTAVIGLLSDIQSWNPYLAEDSSTDNLLALIYPSLAIDEWYLTSEGE